jgi:CMP-N,N'-diacetyllegionaminic acid synthase
MYNGKTILALIPARGGSKGLPRKNILPLAGKPLIAWSIEAALHSDICDQALVTTDDEEIASIALQYGATVPFLRPPELASDDARAIDVILHAMDYERMNDRVYDLLLLLQPTSPLRNGEDIRHAVELYFQKKATAIVSVCESEHSPLWMNTIGPDLCLKDFLADELQNKNRQQLAEFYRLNGAIYLADWDFLIRERSFFGENTFAYIMDRERSTDIDRELDFKFAEFILQQSKG